MSGDDNSLLSTTIYGQLIVADVPNDFVGFSGNTEIPQYAYVEIDRNCSIFGNLYIRTINGFNTDVNGSIVSLGDVNINDRIITPAITLNGVDLTTTLATKATTASPTLTGTPLAPTAATATNDTQIATTAFVNSYVSSLGYTTGSGYAPLASPSLTGTPLAPTAATATNTTQIATTAFVNSYVSSLGYTTGSGYAPLASPSLTGTPLAPTAATATNTTQIATTAFVKAQGYAPLASPSLTGTPLAPTAATATNDTQIATTAFVKAQGYATTSSPNLTGVINITDTTQSISPTTGALVVSGGVGIAGNLNVGNYLTVLKNAYVGDISVKSVIATPIQTGSSSYAYFTSNSLLVSSVSTGYEYALSNGVPYEVVYSTIFNTAYNAYKMFNNDLLDPFVSNAWASAISTYPTTTGEYAGSVSTTTDLGVVLGEYNQIKLPYPLKLKSFKITNVVSTGIGRAKNFVLLGSNDGSTWITLLSSLVPTGTINIVSEFTTPTNNTFYFYFRIIVKDVYNTSGGSSFCGIEELKLYGEAYSVYTPGISSTLVNSILQINGDVGVYNNLYVNGNTTLKSNLNLSGNVNILSTAISSQYTNGALVVAGGVGIAGNLRVNGRCIFNNILSAYNDVYFSTNLVVNQTLTVNTDLTVGGTTTSASFTSGTYYTNYNTDGGGVKTVTVPLNGLYSYIFGANYGDLNITNTAFVIAGGGSACRIYNQYNAGFGFTLTPTGGNTFTVVATYPPGYNSFSISYTKIG